jgi:NADPH-dependent 2,4-dienoyl-CoA reductase/sulfur reductase-like enzyme
VLERIEAAGLIDFVDITMGSHYARHWMTGGSDQPAGYELESAARIGRRSSVPRIVTGRFRTLVEVEAAIASGTAELVSMVRAHIADPDIVSKTRRGEASRVRPCIGCNQGCQARTSGVDQRMGCVVNPVVGHERTLGERLITRAAVAREVLVVGGGPAGLEAARVAATAGHAVRLVEARPVLGGRLAKAAQAPHLGDLGELLAWYDRELDALGVKIEAGVTVDPATIGSTGAEVIIDASGSVTDRTGRTVAALGVPVPGIEHAVLDPADLFGPGAVMVGGSAVVYDDLGQYEALAVTEHLLTVGADVTMVTRLSAVAGALDAGNRVEPALDRFAVLPGRFEALTRARLVEVRPDLCVVAVRGEQGPRVLPAETTVMIRPRRPRGLDWSAITVPVVTVGDALAPRDLQTAIREGHLAARGIV